MRSTWSHGRYSFLVDLRYICVRVFINYRRVPVMLGKVTLHALCEIDMGVILLCQMSKADELFVTIYIYIYIYNGFFSYMNCW